MAYLATVCPHCGREKNESKDIDKSYAFTSQPDYDSSTTSQKRRTTKQKKRTTSQKRPFDLSQFSQIMVGLEKDDLDMYLQAIEVILAEKQASVSMIQRRLRLGYTRAARFIDQMEAHGIVSPYEGSKPREILITKSEWEQLRRLNTR